jgi:(p)ppGpp synthase/HD superfamily hydrolase
MCIMMMTERFDAALAYASALHRRQFRKGARIPYISHLMAVSSLVLEHGGNEDQAIAGLLHDAVEDQGGIEVLQEIERRYGPAVAEIVADCTDAWTDPKPAWRARKEAYLTKLPGEKPGSLLVSLADKTHNARSILFDHSMIGAEIWNRFSVRRDQTLWYYRSLSDVFTDVLPGGLAAEFARTVTALEHCD